MVNIDFTLTKFSELCTAVAQNYHTLTLARYFQGEKLPPERFAMMRHDIDRKPQNALFTVRRKAESGIRATYYFRRYGSGYHYEVLGKAKGDHGRAIGMFEQELGEFRKI